MALSPRCAYCGGPMAAEPDLLPFSKAVHLICLHCGRGLADNTRAPNFCSRGDHEMTPDNTLSDGRCARCVAADDTRHEGWRGRRGTYDRPARGTDRTA